MYLQFLKLLKICQINDFVINKIFFILCFVILLIIKHFSSKQRYFTNNNKNEVTLYEFIYLADKYIEVNENFSRNNIHKNQLNLNSFIKLFVNKLLTHKKLNNGICSLDCLVCRNNKIFSLITGKDFINNFFHEILNLKSSQISKNDFNLNILKIKCMQIHLYLNKNNSILLFEIFKNIYKKNITLDVKLFYENFFNKHFRDG